MASVAGAIAFAVWASYASLRDHQPVLMADDWRIFGAFYASPFFSWVFSNQNGHRVPFTLLLFAADWRWLDGRMLLVTAGSLTAAWLSVAALAAGYRCGRGLDTPLAWAGLAFAGFGLFWAETVGNFLCKVCNANVVSTFFFLLSLSSFVAFAHRQRAGPTRISNGPFLCALLAAALSTFSLGQGIASWAALLVVAIVARVRPAVLASIVVAAVVCAALYLPGLEAHTSRAPIDPKAVIVNRPAALLRFVAVFVGMAPARTARGLEIVSGGLEPASFAIGVFGLGCLAAAGAWALRRPGRVHPQDLIAIGLMSFASAVGAGVGLTRLAVLGPDQAVSERFLDWSWLFWIGAVLALPPMARRAERPWLTAVSAVGIASLVAAMFATLHVHRDVQLRRQTLASRYALALVLSADVSDVKRLGRGIDVQTIWRVAEQMRSEGVNIFAGPGPGLVGTPLGDSFAIAPLDRCDAGLHRPRPAPGGTRVLRVSGWAWDVERDAAPELVVITDSEGIVRGLAGPEAGAGFPDSSGPEDRATFAGYLPEYDPRQFYAVHAVLEHERATCFLGLLPPAPDR